MRQGAAQVLTQRGPNVVGKGAGVLQLRLEGGGGPGQPESFQLGRAALRVLAQQHEVAGIGDQHQPVTVPVATHLVAIRGQPGVVADGFDLDHAAFGKLPIALPAPLHLLGGVESEVGMSGPCCASSLTQKTLGLSVLPKAFSRLVNGG